MEDAGIILQLDSPTESTCMSTLSNHLFIRPHSLSTRASRVRCSLVFTFHSFKKQARSTLSTCVPRSTFTISTSHSLPLPQQSYPSPTLLTDLFISHLMSFPSIPQPQHHPTQPVMSSFSKLPAPILEKSSTESTSIEIPEAIVALAASLTATYPTYVQDFEIKYAAWRHTCLSSGYPPPPSPIPHTSDRIPTSDIQGGKLTTAINDIRNLGPGTIPFLLTHFRDSPLPTDLCKPPQPPTRYPPLALPNR